jgi:hypothetical protein
MWDSQRNNPEATKVTLALATDYFEVLATARSTRLLPGQRCLIALVRKTAAARAGEEYYQDPGNVSVVVFGERRDGLPKRLWEQLVGHGCGGTLLVRDLNRDRKDEIFFWVDGQACAAGVLQMVRSNQARWLYRERGALPSGSTRYEPRWAMGDCGVVVDRSTGRTVLFSDSYAALLVRTQDMAVGQA